MTTASLKKRSRDELLKAVESILYEMVILATALLLRDKRYFFKNYPGLSWGPPQIAHDVIRLKSRLLYEFFQGGTTKHKDITALDFNLTGDLDARALGRLYEFKKKVEKWTVHLSWRRAEEPEYSKADRELMEQYALELLTAAGKFVDQCLASGFELRIWAKPYYDNFKRLHTYLRTTPRVEEGKGVRPAKPIDLETLSLLVGKEVGSGLNKDSAEKPPLSENSGHQK